MQKHGVSTISRVMGEIQRNRIVLPDIQRDFVWSHSQICEFFNSLMEDYPIGTLLYWSVSNQVSKSNTWYEFVQDYHPFLRPRPDKLEGDMGELVAVLDGQQRLTALRIGLGGCIHIKRPNKWWRNLEAYTKNHLYLDLLSSDDNSRYDFKFRPDAKSAPHQFWFKVAWIMNLRTSRSVRRWLKEQGIDSPDAKSRLDHLRRVVHEDKMLASRTVFTQDVNTVQTVFARVNRGGTPLSRSDLILSTSIAQWKERDAREHIVRLIQELEALDFHFRKDFVLKAARMVSESDINFRTKSTSIESLLLNPTKWEDTKSAISVWAKLVKGFGFTESNLTASNALLPIIYYLYQLGVGEDYLLAPEYEGDRGVIRSWLIRSLSKQGVWASSVDGLLVEMRKIIRDNYQSGFPLEAIEYAMQRRGKGLSFNAEDIDAIADMEYGDRRAFMLLSLLTEVKLDEQMHVDHFFPRARFTEGRLKEAGVPESRLKSYRERHNRLANLVLLSGPKNTQKSASLPRDWLMRAFGDRTIVKEFQRQQMLAGVLGTIKSFVGFYERRRKRLKTGIEQLLLWPH